MNRALMSWRLWAIVLVGCVVPAFGQVAVIDYVGFGWETGGLPPSNPGDEFEFVCVANYADPIFGVDLGSSELTFYAYDLISTGEVDIGGGNMMIGYVGGILEVYLDGAMNADWGINPPNATVPSTFNDGILFFQGSFTDFVIFLTPAGDGAFEGHLDGLAGEIINSLCDGCAYTWGGAFVPDSGAQIPEGYDVQIDGSFELDESVSTEAATWGAVKSLFR